jgi:predicted transposase YbfD/YdcC
MDMVQDITLMDVLADLPDPRKRRGIRHAWHVVLAVISAALAAGCRTPHAIGQWVHLHAGVLQATLCPTAKRLPSEATIVRALRQLDLTALERCIAHLGQQAEPIASEGRITCPTGQYLEAQAVDGKALRGAARHGQASHLVSLVRHGSGTTLAQTAVARKRNEIAAVPLLLVGRDLTDTVITSDALLTQQAIARQIRAQGGHYLMVVKRNQRRLYEELEVFFRIGAIVADAEAWDRVQSVSKGHGRIERRTLESRSSEELCAYLGWPGVAQVVQRRCERTIIATGEYSCEVSYGITDLTPRQAGAAQLEHLWRGHWTIENRGHYVRDVTLGEDAGQAHTGSTAHALAAWRNGLLMVLRRAGWSNIADAVRAYAASVHNALDLIGAGPVATLT